MPARARSGERVLWYESVELNVLGRPNLVIWRHAPDGAFHFVYDNQVEFLIEPDGRQIWCAWPERATVSDAAVYLRGPILGFALRMRGVLCLHASAIAIGGSAITIVGAPGAGKSTTAAGFIKLGYSLLADDVAALSMEGGNFHVLPGYPRLNLWPDAGKALYGDADPLPRVTPSDGINDWWDKRYLDLDIDREFSSHPLPLSAVYLLCERAADDERPRVERLSAKDAFMTLAEQTYANYALDESMRAKEFDGLGWLMRTTPIRLVYPDDRTDRLADLCDSILHEHARIARSSVTAR